MIDQSAFGARLQSIRESRKMTQELLAARSGLSAHYIGNIEQGVRMPSANSFMKLCHALGATPNDLLQDSISEDMLNGLSVDISHATTLREVLDVFEGVLGEFFGDDEEDFLFGIPLSEINIPPIASSQDTLSSLLGTHSPDASDP